MVSWSFHFRLIFGRFEPGSLRSFFQKSDLKNPKIPPFHALGANDTAFDPLWANEASRFNLPSRFLKSTLNTPVAERLC